MVYCSLVSRIHPQLPLRRGWKVENKVYCQDVAAAVVLIVVLSRLPGKSVSVLRL